LLCTKSYLDRESNTALEMESIKYICILNCGKKLWNYVRESKSNWRDWSNKKLPAGRAISLKACLIRMFVLTAWIPAGFLVHLLILFILCKERISNSLRPLRYTSLPNYHTDKLIRRDSIASSKQRSTREHSRKILHPQRKVERKSN